MNEPKYKPPLAKMVEYDRFMATAEQFEVRREISRHFIEQAPAVGINSVASVMEDELQNMVIALHTYILGLDHHKDTTTENWDIPASWWNHLKLAHAPKWFTKRWPVKFIQIMKTTMNKETRLCPHCTEKWEDNKRAHLEWMCMRDEQSLVKHPRSK